ncbi:MAG: sulfatase-like hydrolase/transferase [Planctomycetia bacterium]|nr:sulfatase-like hydrolase/transferase [Planctomycetia bacterium]
MRYALFCLSLLVSAFVWGAERPNVVVITASGLGYSDLGCYGGEIRTPVLDNLAAQGMQLTHFYTCGESTRTQTSLLTGQYPHRMGMGMPMENLKWESYAGSVSDASATLGEFFQDLGYHTLAVGKWSLTRTPGYGQAGHAWAVNRGFDRFYGTNLTQTSYFEPKYLLMGREPFPVEQGYYYSYAIGDEAARFLESVSKSNRPFFLYVAFTAPSWPLQAPDEEIQRYLRVYQRGWDSTRIGRLARMKEKRIVPSSIELTPRDGRVVDWSRVGKFMAWQSRRMEVYAAQVSAMDRGIGKILDQLRKMGAEDDTLIVFLSDSGACADELNLKSASQSKFIFDRLEDGTPVQVGNHPQAMPGPVGVFQSYGVPWANVSNTPYRGYAKTLYEGGLLAPCIVKWTNHVAAGKYSGVTHVLDILPTLVEAVDASFPKQIKGKETLSPVGESLCGLFSAKARIDKTMGERVDTSRFLFWECEGNQAVRYGKWKLVRPRGSQAWELYNMVLDPTELRNVYDRYMHEPEVQEMLEKLEQWKRKNLVYEWDKVRARYQKLHAKTKTKKKK